MLAVASPRGFYFTFYEKPGDNMHKQKDKRLLLFVTVLWSSPLSASEMGNKTGKVCSRPVRRQPRVGVSGLTPGSDSAVSTCF